MRANQKMNGSKFALTAIAVAIALSTLASCGGGKAKNGSLVLDSTSTGTNTSPTSSNFTLNATFSLPTPFTLHDASSSNWSGACQVPATKLQYPPVSGGIVQCILEASELDIYLSSLTLSYSVPAGVCEYLVVEPYYAFLYQPNVGASSFTKHISGTGALTLIDGIVPGNSALPANSGVQIANNSAVCPYDYSLASGPNCCAGKYAATVITSSSTGGADVYTTETGSWGGSLGNCAAGPGMDLATAKDSNGLPKWQAIAASQGYANSITVKDPSDGNYPSAMYMANYYPTGTGAPALPGGLSALAYAPGSSAAYVPNKFYQFVCMTHGAETKGAIQLQVRKWNLASELARGSIGNWNQSGYESNGDPIKDFAGWEDISAGAFPREKF